MTARLERREKRVVKPMGKHKIKMVPEAFEDIQDISEGMEGIPKVREAEKMVRDYSKLPMDCHK